MSLYSPNNGPVSRHAYHARKNSLQTKFSASPSAMTSSESPVSNPFFLSELLHDPCFLFFFFLKDFFFKLCTSDSFATFSDIKLFTRTAGVPSGILVDDTGCLLIEDQIHFLLADYLSWLNECFKPFIIANWNASPDVLGHSTFVHNYTVKYKSFLKLIKEIRSSS